MSKLFSIIMEKWDTKTYKNFKWWQKIIFWLFIPQILNWAFWLYVFLLFLFNKKQDQNERRERYVKGIYYWNVIVYSLLVVLVVLL